MRIAVVGATGWLGGEIAREAVRRGHEVTAMARDRGRLEQLDGMRAVAVDATDPAALEAALAGHDAVVGAVTDRSGPDRSVIVAAARALVAAAPKAGVRRIAWMGGGGSLAAPGGGRLVDQPGFPEQYRAEALAQAQALDLFRAAPSDVHWTYLSPPPENLEPGPARAGRRVQAGDEPVVDEHGHSRASSGDLAAAMIDELEQDHFARERFTVGD